MNYTYEYPRPAVTVDAVVFRIHASVLEVLLIQRKFPPFQAMWALPGGFLDMEETPEEAVYRELQEETGLTDIRLNQFHTFGAVNRDPRHRTITVAYYGILQKRNASVFSGDDASSVGWHPLNKLPELAFDHLDIISLAKMCLKKINP